MNIVHGGHDDVIKRKHFPRYWPFVRGIHRSPVNSPHKGQWRGALMLTLICARINDWVNNGEAGDLRRNRAHYDVIVMVTISFLLHTTLKRKLLAASKVAHMTRHPTSEMRWASWQGMKIVSRKLKVIRNVQVMALVSKPETNHTICHGDPAHWHTHTLHRGFFVNVRCLCYILKLKMCPPPPFFFLRWHKRLNFMTPVACGR